MKKLLLIIVAIISLNLSATVNSNAQTVFNIGNFGLNAGFGVGSEGDIFVPSFNVAGDYGFLGNIINGRGCISGGGYFGVGQGSKTVNGVKNIHGVWQIGTRGALHYQFVPNLDTYGCISIGYLHWKDKLDLPDSKPYKNGEMKCFPTAGARYMFGTAGVYTEFSPWNDLAWVKFGLTFIF